MFKTRGGRLRMKLINYYVSSCTCIYGNVHVKY